jgi:hypothetical protein
MIPRGSEAIRHLVMRIAMDQIPKAADAYTATDLGFITALLGMVAQDYDRAAEVFVSEHAALRPIFNAAAAHLDDDDLATRIEAALELEAPSLRVSDLAARSDITMRLLIDIHAAVEVAAVAGAPWARDLDASIWRFLETHVTSHAYDVAL